MPSSNKVRKVTSENYPTDAGREGELIFRLVYHKAGCRKPFERLWISSMEDVAIKEGFENLRSGTEYDALYEAALCRERADWIVGINATRLFSTLYGQTLNVGRVMTPTLAMAVMREAAISAFKPELFYTVQIGLDGFTAASERFKTKAAAEAVKQSCSVAIVQKAECKEKTEKPPALYDLTSLQREANRVLGYTAQQTLDYTQNLYYEHLRADNIEAFSKERNDEYVGRAEEYKAAKSALLEGLGLEHLFDHSHELTPKEKEIWMLFDRVDVAELLARDAFAKGAYMLGAEDREIMLK